MNSTAIKAYAKINLGLDVIRKRPDGYHDIKTIMQTINLYDTVCIKRTRFQSVTVSSNLNFLPTDHRNLAYKAAMLFREKYPFSGGLSIYLNKRIPVSAGLAGGSADAAATLKALNQLYETRLSREELISLGQQVGADVPFCLTMGTALAEGIGEKIKILPSMPDCHILLVKPDINVSTKNVYENLVINDETKHPDIDAMLEALKEKDLYKLAPLMGNILETVTVSDHPVIKDIKDTMKKEGAITSLMSGSGPTVFGIFDSQISAENAFTYFRSSYHGWQIILTKPYNARQ